MRYVNMRRLALELAMLAATALVAVPASATAFSVDQTDLWWNRSESGWGIQLSQTGSTVFATMYVYGLSGQPIWYVATLEAGPAPSMWSGDLFSTTGPYFGAFPFDPTLVQALKVGRMTWAPPSAYSGSLAYDVGGVAVNKTIERQPLRYDSHAGSYLGTIAVTNCLAPDSPPAQIHGNPARFTVAQAIGVLSVTSQVPSAGGLTVCTFAGDYTQSGHLGASAGTFTCSDGSYGTHAFTEMTVARVGSWTVIWSALLTAQYTSGCTVSAHLVGDSQCF